jgi:hypothetical protein
MTAWGTTLAANAKFLKEALLHARVDKSSTLQPKFNFSFGNSVKSTAI